jgi:hypothetical protein
VNKNVPNLVQKQTGPTIYPPMQLPKVTSIPTAVDPHRPNRPNTSPMIPNRTPGGPLSTATNTPNQVR